MFIREINVHSRRPLIPVVRRWGSDAIEIIERRRLGSAESGPSSNSAAE